MGEIAANLVAVAIREWDYFRRTTRSLDDSWQLGANLDDAFRVLLDETVPSNGLMARWDSSAGL